MHSQPSSTQPSPASRTRPLKLAIVGCGAVAERMHLPAAAASPRFEVTALVDRCPERARTLAARYPASVLTDHRRLDGAVEAAIVAVPNCFHADVACALLERGVHVLVEKPMALTAAECDRMIRAAARTGAVLAVGLVHRQFAAMQLVKEILDRRLLGALTSFDLRYGQPSGWAAASDSVFRKETAGGGMLVAHGSHMLDLLLWWLGPWAAVDYADDAGGGVESECRLDLRLRCGLSGVVELSRTRRLRNTWIVTGRNGRLEVDAGRYDPQVRVQLGEEPVTLLGHATRSPGGGDSREILFSRQLESFAAAILTGAAPAVSGTEGRRSVELIETCYASKRPLVMPGSPAVRSVWADRGRPGPLRGARVLVTGGTGFVGARLIEHLMEERPALVRVLVRSFAKAARIGRFPVEMLQGDLTDTEEVRRAVEGCEIIFHCAHGNSTDPAEIVRTNVKGTQMLLDAAARVPIRRLVHLSTIMVYGPPTDGVLDESAPLQRSGLPYADSKLEAEERVLAFAARGLPAVVLQPTAVYGPFAPAWTVAVLNKLKTGRVILVDGGTGLRNLVYIDDLVRAMLLAATSEAGLGERIIVSGGSPVTYRAFYRRYEQMLGVMGTVSLSLPEARAYCRRAARPPSCLPAIWRLLHEDGGLGATRELMVLRRVAKALLPGPVQTRVKAALAAAAVRSSAPPDARPAERRIHPVPVSQLPFLTAKSRVRIEKAKRLLGYEPLVDFETGMSLTEQWARWAELIP